MENNIEYILKFVNPMITIQECAKEDFKKMMGWDEEQFMEKVFVRLKGNHSQELHTSDTGIVLELDTPKIQDVCECGHKKSFHTISPNQLGWSWANCDKCPCKKFTQKIQELLQKIEEMK